jgi:hypothetical protein
MSIVMLWMGIGSTYFTRRTAAASQAVIDQVEPQRPYEAGVPAGGGIQADVHAVVGTTNNLRDAKRIPGAEVANR